jgi:hypothetical protein
LSEIDVCLIRQDKIIDNIENISRLGSGTSAQTSSINRCDINDESDSIQLEDVSSLHPVCDDNGLTRKLDLESVSSLNLSGVITDKTTKMDETEHVTESTYMMCNSNNLSSNGLDNNTS